MQAIVMAAGMGTRLGDLTKERPKPLVQVGKYVALSWVLDTLLASGEVSDIIVVTGYLNEQVEAYIHHNYADKPVKTVFNENFKKGSVLTMLKAKPFIKGGFILANADHLFPSVAYRKLARETKGLTLGNQRSRDAFDDEMKVVFKDGAAELSKQHETYDCGYTGVEAIGDDAVDEYFALAEKMLKEVGDHIVPENLILPFTKEHGVTDCDLSEYDFLEIDDANDLRIAEERIESLKDYDTKH